MEITAQQYISNKKDGGSYVTTFKHYYDKSERKVNKQGDLYALLNISAEKRLNTERISKFVWDSIVDGYLYSKSKTTNESLKESIDCGVNKVKELIVNNKELEQLGVNISFAIVLVKEEGVYVGLFGENDIYAFKKGSVVSISEILKEKRANTAGISLEKNDILMISSPDLLIDNMSRISVLSEKENILKVLDSVGNNLDGTKALLYLSEGLVKKKSGLVPKIENLKQEAGKILRPKARVEKIKKPKEQMNLDNTSEKISANKFLLKVKEINQKIKETLSPMFSKVGNFFANGSNKLGEKMTDSFGKKRWYKRIASKFSEVRIKKRRPVSVKGMRIDDYKVRDLRGRRFKILIMAVILIGLLALGVNFTIKMKHAREISETASEVFVQVEDLLGKSEENFSTDTSSVETYLSQAEELLNSLPGELNEEDTQKTEELGRRVLDLEDSLFKRVGVSEESGSLVNFIDARLAFGEGSEVVDIVNYQDDYENEYLVVADKGRKAIYRISLYDKSVKALPDNDGLITSPEQVYVGVNGVYVYDSEEGMLKAAFDGEGWFSAFTSLSGLGVSNIKSTEIAEMTVWTTSDNVYFLSNDKSALLKSTAAYDDSYGLTYSYLTDDRMASATDMVADLSIYLILPEDPYLIRYNYSYYESQYYEASLGVIGFDGNYGTLTKAFTGDSMDNSLYLFDSEGKRFLRFEKPVESGDEIRHPNEISLLSQYVYRGDDESVWGDVKNFVVDIGEDSMYILDGSVIWKLGL